MATTSRRVFGPRAFTKHDLMGIRFATDPGGDNGAGSGGFTPPASQEEVDRIVEGRLAREREKFKDYDQLKAHSEELTRLRSALGDGDLDAALEAAREEGRGEIRTVLTEDRVNHALTTALAGRTVDPSVLLGGFDKSQFIKDDGADAAAIKAWVDANSSVAGGNEPPKPGPNPAQQGDSQTTTEVDANAAAAEFFESLS